MHITIYVNKKNSELFKQEQEKSKLINNLLERHYFDTVDGGKTQEDIHAEIKEKQDAISLKVPLAPTMLRAIPEILLDIKELERQRDEELEYCQDDKEATRIGKEYKTQIDACWEEYHLVKGDK